MKIMHKAVKSTEVKHVSFICCVLLLTCWENSNLDSWCKLYLQFVVLSVMMTTYWAVLNLV